MDQKKLDQQSQYWEANFLSKPEMFGLEPSIAAVKALKIFKEKNIKKITELGAGLGRDTIFFAKNSIYVESLDYSKASIESITNKSIKLNLAEFIKPKLFDIREKLKSIPHPYCGWRSIPNQNFSTIQINKHGNLAAGTSTGGLTNKRWGRVGDSPIIGAGTYASNETCGVSGTGQGEYFIRGSVAFDIAAQMDYEKKGLRFRSP